MRTRADAADAAVRAVRVVVKQANAAKARAARPLQRPDNAAKEPAPAAKEPENRKAKVPNQRPRAKVAAGADNLPAGVALAVDAAAGAAALAAIRSRRTWAG